MAASTNRKYILLGTILLKNKEMFGKQRKRQIGKIISSIQLVAVILHI